jgi:hypothetical protein
MSCRAGVADHQVAQERQVGGVGAPAQFLLERVDPLVEAGRGGQEAQLEDLLQVAEAVEVEGLGEAHQARRLHPGALGDGLDRVQGHLVGVLHQISRNLLEPLAHLAMAVGDLVDQLLVGQRCRHVPCLVSNRRP